MRIDELFEKWDRINSLSDGFLLVSDDHPLAFHIGYTNGMRAFVVFNTGKIDKIVSSKAILTKCIATGKDKYLVSFVLTNESLKELFVKLCWDLMEHTKLADKPVEELIKRYNNWLKLLQIAGEGKLSSNAQKGLLGELLFLTRMIDELGEDQAISSWVGPEGSDQDFVFQTSWTEVKTVSVSSNTVSIASLQQLDRPDVGHLVVYYMDPTNSLGEYSYSLYSVINSLLGIIQNYNNIDSFRCKLIRLGLYESDLERYKEDNYYLAECREFIVDCSFPKLTNTDVPPEITNLKYEIDLAAIERFRVL